MVILYDKNANCRDLGFVDSAVGSLRHRIVPRFEDQTERVVDVDSELSGPIALKLVESSRRQNPDGCQVLCRGQLGQPLADLTGSGGAPSLDSLALRIARPLHFSMLEVYLHPVTLSTKYSPMRLIT